MKKKNIIILIVIIILILIGASYFLFNKIKEEKKKYEIENITEYNYFVLKENDKYGVIDRLGNIIIQPNYDDLKIPNPTKDIFICYNGEDTEVVNKNNEKIFTQYSNIKPLRLKNVSSDLAYEKSVLTYIENEKYGLISLDGKIISKPIYEQIETLQFKEGELLIIKDGKYGVINIKGAILVKPEYDKIEADGYYLEDIGYKNAGYIVSNKTNEGYRYGYVNKEGKQLIQTKYNELYRISNVDSDNIYLICAENGKYGVIANNTQIIKNEYQSIVYEETNNVFVILKGKKYGVISIEGKTILPFIYSQIDINGNYIYAKTNDENIEVFDSQGKLTNMDPNTVVSRIEGTEYEIHIETIDNFTNYSIYQNGKRKTKETYTYIEYLFNNYFMASNIEGKIGLIDDKEQIKIPFSHTSIQKRLENANIIEVIDIDKDKNIIQLYSDKLNKIVELEDATIEICKGYVKLYNDNEIKYVTNEGVEVKNKEILENNNIFAQKVNNLWGFVDKSGKIIVDFKYNKVTELNKYGFAGIKKNGKWGVINSQGNVIIEPTYEFKDESDINFIGMYYQVKYGYGEIYYTK